MNNIAIFISGTGTNMQSVVKAVQSGEIRNANVSLVLSSSSSAKGLIFAKENDIKTDVVSYKGKSDDEIADFILAKLEEYKIDLVVLAGFIKVIPKKVIDNFDKDIINIHPSLIPLFCGKGYYGLKVHQAVIASGMKVSGATVHYVDSGVDTGKIIMQKTVEVLDDDTAETLQKRVLSQVEHKILKQAVDKVLND